MFEGDELVLGYCTFYGNSGNSALMGAGGIEFWGNEESVLLNTIIAFSTQGHAVSGCALLFCCDIYGNEGGDYVGCIEDQFGINNNISEDPIFCDPANGDFSLSLDSPCVNAPGCGQIGALGLGSCNLVWHVPEEAPTIQAAIDSCVTGDIVIVACGTYYEHDIVMKSGIRVQSESGQPDCVTIDASSLGRVFYCENVDSTTRIEGFTITGGATAEGKQDGRGGGIYCNSSDPVIANCVLESNWAESYGGGIYCEHSSPTLVGCTLSANWTDSDGGGMWCLDAFPALTSCTITGNSGTTGGGLCCEYSSPSVTDCIFFDNSASTGGAVQCASSSSPTFSYCTFVQNSGFSDGAAVYSFDSSQPEMISCTLAGNSGTCVFCYNSASALLDNVIIAFGTGGGAVYCDGSSSATLTCCDVYGNAGGDWEGCIADQLGINGNICLDPMFCEPDSGDYRISGYSPCAPEGSPPGCGLIGAHTIGCDPVSVPEDNVIQPAGVYLAPPTPNPFNPGTTIEYGLAVPGGRVNLAIYDVRGRLVRTLVDRDVEPGGHEVYWDGRDEVGDIVSSGVYFYRLSTPQGVEQRKAVLLK